MNELVELCRRLNTMLKYVPNKEIQQCNEKCCELYGLINAIANLSSSKTAEALDYTIKKIAYASTESNFEVRKKYLSKAINDLLSGMDEIDVVLKYKNILDSYKDMKHPKSKHLGYSAEILIIDDLFGDEYE